MLAVVEQKKQVARPLKMLVPLIQEELKEGTRAGLEHYRQAGAMLIEARAQVAPFKWGRWLKENFELSRTTAFRYMALFQHAETQPDILSASNINKALGHKENRTAQNNWQRVAAAARKIDREEFNIAPKENTEKEENQLHRELAQELIDLGFRALATRLHPDHGGSKDAMRRLNRVREELTALAETRRFV